MIVKGHGLVQEGKALRKDGCKTCDYWYRARLGVGGEGHGKCSCGAVSDHLLSGADRKAWHKDHKALIFDE